MLTFDKNTIIGHRGCDEAKFNNTIESFNRAIDLGAEMIELDVRRTQDNVMIVHHDSDYNGLLLKENEFAIIKDTALKYGLVISSLEQVLRALKGRTKLVIELKETGYEEEAVEMVLRYFNDTEFVVISFNDRSITAVKKAYPNVSAGLLIGDEYDNAAGSKFANMGHLIKLKGELFPWRRGKSTGADLIAPHYKMLHLGLLKEAQKRNIPVFVWTVDQESEMQKLLSSGMVTGLITNKPGLAVKVKNDLK